MPSETYVAAYLNSLPQQDIKSKEDLLLELTKGSVLIALKEQLLLFDLRNVNTDTVLQTQTEPTIQGPQLALSEDIATNINLIRQRYHQPSLTVEMTGTIEEAIETMSPEQLVQDSKYTSTIVKKQLLQTLSMYRQEGIDPLGFGLRYKATRLHNEDNYSNWKRLYPELLFDLSVNVSLKRAGTIKQQLSIKVTAREKRC